jgi:hypothetical protein
MSLFEASLVAVCCYVCAVVVLGLDDLLILPISKHHLSLFLLVASLVVPDP